MNAEGFPDNLPLAGNNCLLFGVTMRKCVETLPSSGCKQNPYGGVIRSLSCHTKGAQTSRIRLIKTLLALLCTANLLHNIALNYRDVLACISFHTLLSPLSLCPQKPVIFRQAAQPIWGHPQPVGGSASSLRRPGLACQRPRGDQQDTLENLGPEPERDRARLQSVTERQERNPSVN